MSMRATLHNQRGSTLIEFIIYVGLIAVVLTTAVMLMAEMLRAQAKSTALAEASRHARFGMSRVLAEIREADSVNVGSSTFGANPGTLSLATTSGGTNPTVFTVASGALMVQQGAGSPIALTGGNVTVSDFTVTNLSVTGRSKVVRVRLTVTSSGGSNFTDQTATVTFEGTARVQSRDGFSN